MPRFVLLTLGIATAIGAVLVAVAWGPSCQNGCASLPASGSRISIRCGPITTCDAHVALRVGIAMVGVGAGLAFVIGVVKFTIVCGSHLGRPRSRVFPALG